MAETIKLELRLTDLTIDQLIEITEMKGKNISPRDLKVFLVDVTGWEPARVGKLTITQMYQVLTQLQDAVTEINERAVPLAMSDGSSPTPTGTDIPLPSGSS